MKTRTGEMSIVSEIYVIRKIDEITDISGNPTTRVSLARANPWKVTARADPSIASTRIADNVEGEVAGFL